MNEINKRFKYLVEILEDGNLNQLARKIGIRQSTLFRYTEERSPHVATLLALRNKYLINLNWFVAGDGEIYDHKEQGRVQTPEISHKILAEVMENLQEEFFPGSEMAPDLMAELIILAYKKVEELIKSRPEQKDDLRCDEVNTFEKVS